MSHWRKRTTSNDRVLEWETPTKELGVCQSTDGTREALAREVPLGARLNNVASRLGCAVRARERSTRDGGGEGGQDWDEGEDPHGVLLGRKECGAEERVGSLELREGEKRGGPLERQKYRPSQFYIHLPVRRP